MALFWLIILAIFFTVDAEPAPNYPLNAQIPPVARVSKPYRFIFAEGTFANGAPDTEYSLSDAPSWLKVDSKSRSLSGTPQSGDVGSQKFDLVASDSAGSASMEVTLFVSEDEGPKPGKPLLPQLEKIGATSAPSTIFVHAGDSFSISFDPETFTNTLPDTIYYGTSPDNSPLPSWMEFDESSLKFTGTSPTVGPQTFTFHLVASDVVGFSAATLTFQMTISPHILSFNESYQTFQLTPGKKFTSPRFYDMLTLDGEEPASEDLDKIDVKSPNWLTLDKDSISLSGTPPDDAVNENVTISVTDTHQDVTDLIVRLEFPQSSLFVSDPKDCDANIGEDFECVFDHSVLTDDGVQLEVHLGQQISSWSQYNPETKTLSGHVPEDASPQKIDIDLTASKGSDEHTETFTINIAEAGHHEKNSDDDDNPGSGGIHEKKAGIIAISVVIPLVFLSSVILFLCCARRKHKNKAAANEEGQFPPEKPPLPRPSGPDLPRCQPYEDTASIHQPEITSQPPKLELYLNSGAFGKKDQTDNEANKENNFSRSAIEWDFPPLKIPEPSEDKHVAEAPQNKRLSFQTSPSVRRQTSQSKRREPLKPIQPRRSLKRNSAMSSRSKRHSKRSSGISSVASGLPIRYSGAGHGAGGFGPPGHGVVRMSWQNTHASLQSEESQLGNLAPLFPRPPPRARDSFQKRTSLRAVEPDISESNSLDAFVYGRAKSRNSSNPMFSGQTNRRRSSGVRALERARSTASRGDTISIYTDDCNGQPIQDRPYSVANSSNYADDNRQSTYLRPLSQISSMQPSVAPFTREQSQSSLAQNYRDIITPLPRVFSETSEASARPFDFGDMRGSPDNYSNLAHQDNGGQRRWYQGTPYPQTDASATHRQNSLRKSPSLSSIPIEGKGQRLSLVRFADKENEPMSETGYQWQNHTRRPLSMQSHNGLPRDISGGAFV
ncbi:hypothetical protein ASPWEDRAFT_106611 [Aspergillus wentii DTO 134E9]|uniref:Dystroglycan-type cadherin-like domain-containing protein n=1 Tax=Aspergillus wentii DTO 134E9 TaxID=1073089 RepID=A0A1L9RUQ9_ASPWE|nr:uncharacterized protein ASPWEDRAFT_106611 [Aspergillus wentii DTO 134E9]KAI9928550.1 hypothetical protein MW887_001764 [Aspergillus wentii]OJJ38624.1 hypothetical protein ASPWEDRAFT_106611 [Aspergillus wentii DTO 134E9]